MGSIALLSAFSTWVLLVPPQPAALILDLMPVPWRARLMTGVAVLVNVGVSFAYEEWIAARVAKAVGVITQRESGRRRRRREAGGRVYEAL
jgi:cation-transporting P-type ATPase 13A2